MASVRRSMKTKHWGVWVTSNPSYATPKPDGSRGVDSEGWVRDRDGRPWAGTEQEASQLARSRNEGPKSWPTVRFEARKLS